MPNYDVNDAVAQYGAPSFSRSLAAASDPSQSAVTRSEQAVTFQAGTFYRYAQQPLGTDMGMQYARVLVPTIMPGGSVARPTVGQVFPRGKT